ncbi:tRNA pseudouridine55 synthase [Ruminiclostridium sufflavum DSM 19573]|uniref:tRNA pseudouridine synthase B n=1 Tax=Ruminiclostridium sufflavum DSM 19573 TaxID=1121337 RepID=A0A318XLV6_9FIRM|nr:tRNA pseudouridine(55) synthase TruB [Ruminiclostridium sufflavum]PYG88417.1 tRNA pseudouridine55 synthase [Ruminiclostridium sufflavum DSM 19573]
MNGILNVLKPAGMTSFDVIAVARKISHQKRIGHTGTLDPSAVGVLPLCFGNATKAIEFMIDKDKIYRAELTLGVATDTQDSSGRVTASRCVDSDDSTIISAINSFIGNTAQIPPMYSAIKIGGKKLYELARQGETVERQARNITIYDISKIRIWKQAVVFSDNGQDTLYNTKKVLFDVHCSKGTYIRTLCNDIGEKLGCGGHMSFLVRTKAGRYDIKSALTLEEIMELADKGILSRSLLPVETVFEEYEKIALNEENSSRYNNGVCIKLDSDYGNEDINKRVYDNNNAFLGIGEILNMQKGIYLKSKKFFRDN